MSKTITNKDIIVHSIITHLTTDHIIVVEKDNKLCLPNSKINHTQTPISASCEHITNELELIPNLHFTSPTNPNIFSIWKNNILHQVMLYKFECHPCIELSEESIYSDIRWLHQTHINYDHIRSLDNITIDIIEYYEYNKQKFSAMFNGI